MTRSALATAATSLGRGSKSCGSPPGRSIPSTETRPAPTWLTRVAPPALSSRRRSGRRGRRAVAAAGDRPARGQPKNAEPPHAAIVLRTILPRILEPLELDRLLRVVLRRGPGRRRRRPRARQHPLPRRPPCSVPPRGRRRREHRHLRRGRDGGRGRPHPRGQDQLAAVRLDGAAVDAGRGGRRLRVRGASPTTSCSRRSARSSCVLRRRSPTREGAARPPRQCAQAGELDIRAAVLTGLGDRRARRAGGADPRRAADACTAPLRRRGVPAQAVGTNLAVGVGVGITGVARAYARLASTGTCWRSARRRPVPGALLGARLTGRLSERQLLRAIGAMLVVASATTALQALW